jgi:hypothetical protein
MKPWMRKILEYVGLAVVLGVVLYISVLMTLMEGQRQFVRTYCNENGDLVSHYVIELEDGGRQLTDDIIVEGGCQNEQESR